MKYKLANNSCQELVVGGQTLGLEDWAKKTDAEFAVILDEIWQICESLDEDDVRSQREFSGYKTLECKLR